VPPRRLALALVLLSVYLLAVALRLQSVGAASIGSDALGQLLAAYAAGWGHLPPPPNPEGGYSLWVVAWPMVRLAGSLHEVFVLRFGWGALAAPAAGLGAALLDPDRPRAPLLAALAGGLVAADPGLVDTLVIAFRGYGAPELVGLGTVGLLLALRGSRGGLLLATLAFVLASGQHPMGTAGGLGALVLLPALVRRLGGWTVGAAALLALVLVTPRLLILARMADCGQGAAACLSAVALQSSEADVSPLAFVTRAFHDRFAVEWRSAWWALPPALLLCLPGLRRPEAAGRRAALAYALAAVVALLLVGLSVSSLRSYHLRVLAVPIAIAAAAGLSRLGWASLLLLPWLAGQWLPIAVVPPARGSVELADRLGDELQRELVGEPGAIRVDGVWFDRPEGVDPAAVVLSAVLHGADPARFGLDPSAAVLLLVHDAPRLAPGSACTAVTGATWLQICRFPSRAEAEVWRESWGDTPLRMGGAYDWMKALHPSGAELGRAGWDR
jgi:hypothetical protein